MVSLVMEMVSAGTRGACDGPAHVRSRRHCLVPHSFVVTLKDLRLCKFPMGDTSYLGKLRTLVLPANDRYSVTIWLNLVPAW